MLIFVGKVERIVLGRLQRSCACCALHIDSCRCDHSQEHWDTSCPNRHSTF